MLKLSRALAVLTCVATGLAAPALLAHPSEAAQSEAEQADTPVQHDDMDDRLTGGRGQDWRALEAERQMDEANGRSFGQDARHARVTLTFKICVAADGSLTCLTPSAGQSEALAQQLLQQIPSWRFSPAEKNGLGVAAESHLYVTLEGERRLQDRLDLKVTSATVGPLATRMPAPRYPAQALRSRRAGAVLLSAKLDSSGKVISVDEVESNGPHSMVVSAKRAVAAWQFEPEKVEGVALASEVLVPIYFQLYGQPAPKLNWVDRNSLPLDAPIASESVIKVEIPEHG